MKNFESFSLIYKKRYIIENSFANIEKTERIMVRKDKKINTYMSLFFGIILFILQHKSFNIFLLLGSSMK